VSGSNDLVTGASAGDFDVDGGITTITSGSIALPALSSLTLTFSQYLAHGSNSSSADYLRVGVQVGTTTTWVWTRTGAAANLNGAWSTASASLNQFAGQPTVRLVVQAADASTASLVEAGVDDVRITGI
jgi:hypothetical protein